MSAMPGSPNVSEWRRLASLGEQLVNATDLAAQKERILQMTRRLVDGSIALWLDEGLFRLPGADAVPTFPPDPPAGGLRRAWESGQMARSNGRAKKHWVSVPIADQGVVMGALQVSREGAFRPGELDLLEGLASIVALGLLGSHRAAVERFRLEQLNLVRQVSAQIANVLDVDELARRVTDLIQKTFNYYYVAFFTLKPGAKSLRFRASASAPRPGRKKNIVLEAALGQGLIGQAAQDGEKQISDDVQEDPRYRFVGALPETKSEVALPLKIEERVLGVLDVQSNQPEAFHPNDLLILEALADTIARAVEGARLYGDLRRRADQLSLIAEVSRGVSSSLDLGELMRSAAKLIRKRFGYPFVHMFSVHPNRRTIQYEAGVGKRSKRLEGASFKLDDPQGIIPWVARNGETVVANDVTTEPRYRPSPLPPKTIRAEMCVPLNFDERVVGLLDIQTDRHAFTEDDQMIFEAVADAIAAAIHNADTFRTEQWRRRVADSLREVAGLLSDNVGVDESLQAILTELGANLPVDIAAIWLLGDAAGDLYLAACTNCDLDMLEKSRFENPEASLAMMSALMAPEPIVRKPSDPLWPSGIAAGFDADYSSIAAPLRIGEQPLGVITLAHATPGRYGHEAQNMLSTFASYAAVAIENARLYDQAQEQAYASAALLQVAQAVVSLSELDEILGTIVRIMPILVGVDRAVLYLYVPEHDRFHPVQEYGFAEEDEPFFQRDLAPGEFLLLDSACETNRLLIRTLEPETSPRAWFTLPPPSDDQADASFSGEDPLLLTVPLSIKHDLFGVLVVEEAPGRHALRFRSRRMEIISGIAQQAALAIQNDRLQKEMVVRERLETEVQLARQIQQTFIPDVLPEHPQWQLAARWRTARQVGGDFYDVMELPDNRLGLFIADVADKGMPAALFMALTRTLIHAAVIETPSPAEALRRVNELLLPDTKQGMFVTAVYAVLNQETGELTYCNAGHNPPLVIRKGTVEKLTRTGVALGAWSDSVFEEKTIALESGESLLLYTDGLTEAFNLEGDMFGEERLLRAIGWRDAASAEDMLKTVESALDDFIADAPPSDDLTMLAARRV